MEEVQEKKLPPFSLRSIYIRNASMKMDESFDPLLPGQKLVGRFMSAPNHVIFREHTMKGGEIELTIRCYGFSTNFAFAYFLVQGEGAEAPAKDDLPMAEITAEIVADYTIETQEEISQKVLDDWSVTNVLFHTWPYWREFCQSSTQRMHLPALVMPLIDIKQPPVPKGEGEKE